eukprot:s33_g3.t1
MPHFVLALPSVRVLAGIGIGLGKGQLNPGRMTVMALLIVPTRKTKSLCAAWTSSNQERANPQQSYQ